MGYGELIKMDELASAANPVDLFYKGTFWSKLLCTLFNRRHCANIVGGNQREWRSRERGRPGPIRVETGALRVLNNNCCAGQLFMKHRWKAICCPMSW